MMKMTIGSAALVVRGAARRALRTGFSSRWRIDMAWNRWPFRQRSSSRWRQMVLAVVAGISFGAAGHADTLHRIQDGAHQHHFSLWIYPQRIGEFVRVGTPTDIDGTADVIATYQRLLDGVRTTATVDVYPPDSYAVEATLERARAAIRRAAGSEELIEQPFMVGAERALKGVKVSAARSASSLYFFDTGAWIIKVRGTTERAGSGTDQALDEFVRSQRWDSLDLSDEACTGPACQAGSEASAKASLAAATD
jgi:hypothetical protein